MKKLILIGLLLILCVSMVAANQVVYTRADELRIDLLTYSPSPVQPGERSELSFEVINLAEEALTDLTITLIEDFPFFLDTGADAVIDLDTFSSGAKESFKFPIVANSNIDDGFYTLRLQFYSSKTNQITSEPFTIYVQKANRVISPTSVQVTSVLEDDAGNFYPGEASQVVVHVQNFAAYHMKDVSVKLNLTDSGIPFAPYGSTSEKNVQSVGIGEGHDVVFDIIALPDAASGVYKVPLTLVYYDDQGIQYTKNNLIGLVISATPELHFEIKDNEIYSKKGMGEITVDIVNIGLTNLKFVTVELNEPLLESKKIFGYTIKEWPEFKLLSEDKIYLGDIEPDDDENVDFLLNLKSKDDFITLPLTLTYLDANNNEYTESVELEVEIYSMKELGMGNGSPWLTIFVIIVLAVYAFGFWRWRKKHPRKGLLQYTKFLFSFFSKKK